MTLSAAKTGTPYSVREEPGITQKEWDARLRSSPGGGHFFQTHEWGEFKRSLGWEPLRLLLEHTKERAKERAKEPLGCGQFLLRRTHPVPGRLMFCPKGPWLPWHDEEAVRAFFAGAVEVARRRGVHTLKIEPEVAEDREDVKALLGSLGFEKFRWDVNFKTTIVVDLGRSEEDLLAGMKRGTRYNVRLAARKGVRVVEDNSAAARELFWEMFEVVGRRQGFWYRPRAYMLATWQALQEAGLASMFFAEHEGDRLAALLAVTFGEKYWYLAGVSGDEKRNLKPTYLLQWEAMKWAKRRGATYYDMVNIPSPDQLTEDNPQYGVYKFKIGFGGEISDFIGCYDLPVKQPQARLWNRIEPTYYRLHQRLQGNVYY